MKASELMIGDLIYVYGRNNNILSKPHWHVKQATADWLVIMERIERNNKKLLDNGIVIPDNQPFIGDTKPIPLTDEILKKNGFRESSIESGCYYFPEKYQGLNDRGFAVETDGEGRFWITDHQLMMIRYVHELQNALRLCGLNELANNLKIE